ncbi:MAG: Tetratricopeptide repeat [Verrucomicrobiota bacterium]|jgi:tetratricopeptide (TPR) repeat protein
MPAPGYILALLFTGIFTLATWLQPHALTFNQSRKQSDNLLALTLGDARRMFANHFFTKADVYFHSGYYPSIFDQNRTNENHIAEAASSADHADHAEDEHEFLKPPRDWLEKFGRNFFNTEHTELSNDKAQEMLPWLRVAAELDPQQVEIYTVGAFWLREKLKRTDEAEQFLREGLRANPESHEILFELGRLFADGRQDYARACNVLELADRKLTTQETKTGGFDLLATRQILMALAKSETQVGLYPAAIAHLQRLADQLPPEQADHKKEILLQADELRARQK